MRNAATLGLVVVALAGCGADAAKRFAERGNAICRETRQKTQGSEGLVRLKALEPPAQLRAARDRFFADLAALAHLAPITTPAKRARAADLANRLPVEARALGWTDCAA